MRNVTIKRKKSFVACLVKMKVYVEDPISFDMVIDDVPCRKIGELKNGEEKTFQIGEQAAKIFVIADQFSKNYCNEYYALGEGDADIFLSGKNYFNPASGNAFRFDDNESEEVLANRKRGTRRGLRVLILAVALGVAVGVLISWLSGRAPSEATFRAEGMSITLTDEFVELDVETHTVAYGSEKVAVFALKEAFSLLEGSEKLTLEEYGELVLQAADRPFAELKSKGDMKFFVYDAANPETNETYRYFSYIYKARDAFWLVQFATLAKNADSYEQQIWEWASSIEFSS